MAGVVRQHLQPCLPVLKPCLAQLGVQVSLEDADVAEGSAAGNKQSDSPLRSVAKKKTEPKRAAISAEATTEAHASHILHEYTKSDTQREMLMSGCKASPIFASMDSAELEKAVAVMFERRCKPGEHVIVQGDDGDNMYMVESGEYAVILKQKGPAPVHFYKAGDSFGELALMYNTPRAATVQCISGGLLWALDRMSFRKIMMSSQKKAEASTAMVSTAIVRAPTSFAGYSFCICTYTHYASLVEQLTRMPQLARSMQLALSPQLAQRSKRRGRIMPRSCQSLRSAIAALNRSPHEHSVIPPYSASCCLSSRAASLL